MKKILLALSIAISVTSCNKTSTPTPAVATYVNNTAITFTQSHSYNYSNAAARATLFLLDNTNAVDGATVTIKLNAVNGYDLHFSTVHTIGAIEYKQGSLSSKNSESAVYLVTIRYVAAHNGLGEYFLVGIEPSKS